MITKVQGYTSFNGIKNVKPHKVARKIVSTEKNAPKGLSSPIRMEDAIDDLLKAGEKRFDNSNGSEKLTAMLFTAGTVTAALDLGFSR